MKRTRLVGAAVAVIATAALAVPFWPDDASPRPTPSATDEQTPRAAELAVAFAVSTGWPHSPFWAGLRSLTSDGDVVTAHAALTSDPDTTDAETLCEALLSFSADDVAGVGPISQVIVQDAHGTSLWVCA